MDMNGEYRIAAPRAAVWAALNDPDILRRCIPGCESVEKVSDTEFAAKATVKVGPVKAKFAGRVTLSDMDPPNGYTITGEGQGGAAGFGSGGARVGLAEDGPGATILRYTAEAQVGGKLAQIGSRLVQGTAKKMADDFFAAFAGILGSPDAADTPAETPMETSAEPLMSIPAATEPPAEAPAAPAKRTRKKAAKTFETPPETVSEPVAPLVAEEPAPKPKRSRKKAASADAPAMVDIPAQSAVEVPPGPLDEATSPEPMVGAAPVPPLQVEPPQPAPLPEPEPEPEPAAVAAAAGPSQLEPVVPMAAAPAVEPGTKGMRPLVWIPLLILVLLLMVVLVR
ncbi:MAG TPA: SRPBCC domain-containing protein [Azospirillaceae bacterium]|nr:SRPBCC domain-containing protein [Azospirillaceae bacterium]